MVDENNVNERLAVVEYKLDNVSYQITDMNTKLGPLILAYEAEKLNKNKSLGRWRLTSIIVGVIAIFWDKLASLLTIK